MKKAFLFTFVLVFLISYGFSIDDARLLRFPNINKDLIAFVYAGDIWTVPATGGNASRLTSHEGMELFPRISPDGKWIAFSAEYSGSRQVHVMPAQGGEPRQLTYYNDFSDLPPRGGFDHIVLGWTPDSKQILILSNHTPYEERMQKFFLVDLEGGLETPLQIPEAGFGSFSPDGKQIVYALISREFRTWKRYKGGRAQDIWTYDLEKNTSEHITDFTGTDQHPFWFNDKLFFISDRDLKLNFWSYDLKTKEYKQVTFHKEFDALWPSGNNGLLAYENGGYIYILNLKTGESHKVTINLNFDNPNRLPYVKNVKEFISSQSAGLSPDGKRAIFSARGDIYTVPAENGVTVNLTRSQGIREKDAVWSPDGKWIAYYSDKTGNYEIYLIDPEKKKEPIQLTTDHTIWKFTPIWSPDSKKLLFSDTNWKLQVLDIQTKKITVVDKGDVNTIDNYQWSADSKWIVYSKTATNNLSGIWVYSLENGKSNNLSAGRYNDDSPVFSKCGQYIFFISDRDFNLNNIAFTPFGDEQLYQKTSRLYALALTKNTPNLFKEENDLEKTGKPDTPIVKEKQPKSPDTKPKPEINPIIIDFNGIQDRVSAFPMKTDNYNTVVDLGGQLLYRNNNGDTRLFDLKSKEDKEFMKINGSFALSSDYKKILYSSNGKWLISDIKPGLKDGEGQLNLDGLVMKIDPVKEWEQIYSDGCRIFRDWFYAANMHGMDWAKIREKYAPLVGFLGHRADLDYILGEIAGELNVGHSYINWGDFKRPERIDGGLLGVELKPEKNSKRYIISKIYKGENWNEDTRSPLTEQGIDVKEGDYIIRIDDYDVTTTDNPYRFLENTVGKKITITVNSKPTEDGARTFWIKPIKCEQNLRYMDWVESRRKMVDKLSNGRIGYFHVPNTAEEGFREFYKGLYAFNDKEAFIIDERYNGGGWFPTKLIRKLEEKPVAYWSRRNLLLQSDPNYTLNGPKAMLINYDSASGGDYFPYMFKNRKLGKLFGTRTWGGLIGINENGDMVDGAGISVPTFAITDTEGKFAVEGIGVCPDVEIYDRPEEIVKGNDPTLEAAIKYLLEELEKNPKKTPPPPADPDRSKWHEEMPDNNSTGCKK